VNSLGIFSLIYYFIGVTTASVAYHRMLAHRSVEFRRPFRNLLVLVGLPAGTPIQWAGNHRQHHRFTDVEGDPHSPYLGGFWYAHCGWYISSKSPLLCLGYALAGPLRTLIDAWHRPRSNQQFNHLAKDIAEDDFFKFLSRPAVYTTLVTLHVAVSLSLFGYFWGLSGVMTYWALMIVLYNTGDSIDSLAHLFGRRDPNAKHQARDSYITAIFTGGEGWHASHHSHPGRARLVDWPRIDLGWLIISFFGFLGLVKSVRQD